MKKRAELKWDIAHRPDDNQICEDCNYELEDKIDDDGEAAKQCTARMKCASTELNPYILIVR